MWRRLAPAAIEAGNLTRQTVSGLEHLCQVCVTYDRLRQTIDAEGWQVNLFDITKQGEKILVDQKRHVLWPQLQAFAVRREQGLRAYGLLGSGKLVPQHAGSAGSDDPWEALEANRRR